MRARTVFAKLRVDDDIAMDESMGTIEYLEKVMNAHEESGIYLDDARIVDFDDPDDKTINKYVQSVFGD